MLHVSKVILIGCLIFQLQNVQQLYAQCPASCSSGTHVISSSSSTNYTLSTSESLSIQSGATYSGTVTINGTGTQINNCGTFAGTLTYTSGAFTIVNSGTWNTTAKLTIPNSSTLTNCTGAIYSKTGNADGIELTGTGTLTNAGTMSISTSGSNSKALIPNGSGLVTNNGTITLYGKLEITGSNTLTNNSIINIYRDAGNNNGTGILSNGNASSQTIDNYGDIICYNDDEATMAQTINNYGYMEFYNLTMSANVATNDCRIKIRNNYLNAGNVDGASLASGNVGRMDVGGTSTTSGRFGIDPWLTTNTRIDFCDEGHPSGGWDSKGGYYGTQVTNCTAQGSCPSCNTCSPLSISITASVSSICSGSSSTLSTTVSNGTPSYSYSWAASSGTAPSGASPSVSPTTTTTYTVTVTDNASHTVTATTAITVNALPTASISGSSSICTGTSTAITATGGGTYAWNTSATTASITVSPTANTTYIVTVTSNGCTATANKTITVNANPTVNAGNDVAICNGASTNLTASGGGTYLWSTSYQTAGLTVTPQTTTTYIITVTNTNNCTATDAVVVTVNNLPTVSAGNDLTICKGASTTLTATGGETYLWNTTATTPQLNVSPSSTTTYSITATSSDGCVGTAQVLVTVSPLVEAGNDIAICSGNSTNLTASGGVSYVWNTTASTQQLNVSPSSTTTYTVTATDNNSCTASDEIVVTVNPNPTANAGADVEICSGKSTTLTATGGDTYEWSTSATTQQINVSPSIASSYTVSVTNTNGCTGSDAVVVSVIPSPTVNIQSSDVAVSQGKSATLTVSGDGTYTWFNSSSSSSITVSPTTTTSYAVTVIASNGCTTSADVVVAVNINSSTSIAGDITGPLNDLLVTGIQGNSISNEQPLNGDVLQYDSLQHKWIPSDSSILMNLRVRNELVIGDSSLRLSSNYSPEQSSIENVIYTDKGDLKLQSTTYFNELHYRRGTNPPQPYYIRRYIKPTGNTYINAGNDGTSLNAGSVIIGGSFGLNHTEKLEVIGGGIKTTGNLITGGDLNFGNTGTSVKKIIFGSGTGDDYIGICNITNASQKIFNIVQNDISKFSIDGIGTVRIGTINSLSSFSNISNIKLAVNGAIVSEEVYITDNVPASDYVFGKNYHLRSLHEIETYVNKHQHLPEVPSAEEFKANGYKVGTMDDILLRKIEELTLYIIQQQKQIDELQRLQNTK